MKEVKEFFNSALERVSNQFMISYLISWIILNWKLVIAFFKYNAVEFDTTHGINYMTYLQSLVCPYGLSFFIPLLPAALYVWLVKPWIDIWINKIEVEKNLKINLQHHKANQHSYMPYSLYFQRVNEMESKIDNFKKSFSTHSETVQQKLLLETENLNYQNKINKLEESLSTLKNIFIEYRYQTIKFLDDISDESKVNTSVGSTHLFKNITGKISVFRYGPEIQKLNNDYENLQSQMPPKDVNESSS